MDTLYQLFISSVPSKVTLEQLEEKLDAIASQNLILTKQKAKGRNKRVYNLLIETSNFDDFTKLRNLELRIEETIVQIRQYTQYNQCPSQPQDRDERKVYVGDLPEAVQAETVREALESFGKVDDIFVRRGVRNQAVYALVTFSWRSDADVACSQGKVPLKNHSDLSIRKYHPQVSKSERPDKGKNQTSKKLKKKKKKNKQQPLFPTQQHQPTPSTNQVIPLPRPGQQDPREQGFDRHPEAYSKSQFDALNREVIRTAPPTRQQDHNQPRQRSIRNWRLLQISSGNQQHFQDSVLKAKLVLRQLVNHNTDNLRFTRHKN